MSSVASSHLPTDSPAFADYASHAPAHTAIKSLLASTWQMLDQPPPPSLREILGAYRTRGDGDREMLMAMLNAKSAEDQRLASMASLHRSMLEYYQIVPTPHTTSSTEPAFPPVLEAPPRLNGTYHPRSSTTDSSAYRSPRTTRDPSHARKRHRSSESPASPYRSPQHSHSSSSPHHAPSPPSSLHSEGYDRSPRSREAMAIDSLLSAGAREAAREEVNGARRGNGRRDGIPECQTMGGRTHRPSSNSMPIVSV